MLLILKAGLLALFSQSNGNPITTQLSSLISLEAGLANPQAQLQLLDPDSTQVAQAILVSEPPADVHQSSHQHLALPRSAESGEWWDQIVWVLISLHHSLVLG